MSTFECAVEGRLVTGALLDAMNAGHLDISAEDFHGWIKHGSKRDSFPGKRRHKI